MFHRPSLTLVQKVIHHLGLIPWDFEPFSRPYEYGNFEIKRDIRVFATVVLTPIISFLQGHHPRLGHSSKVSFLQNLLVVDPILQTKLQSKGLLDLILI